MYRDIQREKSIIYDSASLTGRRRVMCYAGYCSKEVLRVDYSLLLS